MKHIKMKGLLIIGMMVLAIGNAAGSMLFGVAGTAGVLCLTQFLPKVTNVNIMGTTYTEVDAIAKWAGLYSKKMFSQMLNQLDIFKDLNVDRLVSRHGKLLPKFMAQGGLRPLNTNITSNGPNQRKWSGRKLFVWDAMKIFNVKPDDLISSFQSDMLAPGAIQVPFAQWFWEKEMEKLASEVNDNFYFAESTEGALPFDNGAAYTYSATVPQYVTFGELEDIYKLKATTTAGQTPLSHSAKWEKFNQKGICNGPGTIIAREITASKITPIVTGAITSSNALDKIELMYSSMTVPHRNKGGIVFMSPDVYRKYLDHERTKYVNTVASPDFGDGKKYVYGTGKKWELKECSWMGSSQRIIMTQFENMTVGTNLQANPGITKSVETLHGTDSVSKFLLGFEIADLENFYCNDQA
jgi:hypothetical protein